MGFTTGFAGGVTLTLGLAYLTVLSHERNRQAQALYLRSQSQLLNSLIDPTPIPPPSRSELARQSRNTFSEIAKDRWNNEVENAVRWIQTTDWHGVRENMEGAVARALGLGLQKSREVIEQEEKEAGAKVQEAVDRSKAAARQGVEKAAVGVDRAAAATIAGTERVTGAAKEGIIEGAVATKEGLKDSGVKTKDMASSTKASASKAVSDAKASVQDVAASARGVGEGGVEKAEHAADKARTEIPDLSAGTVDAARGAMRNVISKGIEKGKEVIGKTQAAVGLATEKTEVASKNTSLSPGLSPVEKALRGRYEKLHGLDRTAEEVLEERYRTMDQRDNTALRGV